MKKFISGKLAVMVAGPIIGLVAFGGGYWISTIGKSSNHNAASACSSQDKCVSLLENRAEPEEVAVKAGSYVQFNSADGRHHKLSLGRGGEEHDHHGPFHSPEFGVDEGWRVQFKTDGTYVFHDHLNPKISTVVVVYSEGKDYKITREN